MGDSEALGKAIRALRELPDIRPDATARLLIAVAAERQRRRDAAVDGRRTSRRVWAGMVAAAAVVVAVAFLPTALRKRTTAPVAATVATVSDVAALPASNAVDLANSPRSVQLVFSAPEARSVRVAGDFNGWNERQSPMVHDEVSGLWNVTLLLRPGRHVYAFVVNDTQWVRDPRAKSAPDADFGRPGSVVLVGRP